VGLNEYGTAGAAHYPRNQWKKLAREFGKERPFLRILRIPGGYKNWQEIESIH
jgi:hypothetical protein